MKKLALVLGLVIILSGCGGATDVRSSQGDVIKGETLKKETTTPEPKEAQEEEALKLPVEPEMPGAVVVMIDNYKKAYPHSGLDKADIVFEMVAEAGITRYMAVFYSQKADKIGPIRSARPYFAELARGYDAPYAHAGGSGEALDLIDSLKIKDMDEIYNSGAYFWRDKVRKMPHNLYTSTELLVKGAKSKGYSLIPLSEISRVEEGAGEVHNSNLVINYTNGDYPYTVSWHFDGKQYNRMINNKSHVLDNDIPVIAANVFVMKVSTKTVMKGNIPLADIKIIGKGETLYFIDGKVKGGKWEKSAVSKPLNFYDEMGNPIKVKRGNIWVQAVPDWDNITY